MSKLDAETMDNIRNSRYVARGLPADVALKYRRRLTVHVSAVQTFGLKLGLPAYQLEEHDESKWDEAEFIPYARYFVEHGGSPVDRPDVNDGFAQAWLHHIHHNPHHWQHWIFPDGYCPPGSSVEPGGVVEMPERYALEMIADWHGAGYAYTGFWDIAEWLGKNMPRIRVHSKTAVFLRSKLSDLGYATVVNAAPFAGETRHDEKMAAKFKTMVNKLEERYGR